MCNHITVIIVFYNSLEDLRCCLQALCSQSLQPKQIIIVDNSPSGQCKEIASTDKVVILRPNSNLGFARGNNWAISKADTDLILTLNADAFPRRNCLEELSKASIRHPECGAFGCVQLKAEDERILDGVGDVYHASGLMWRRGYGRLASKFELVDGPISSPCGAAALYRKSVFDSVGGFDEDFFCYCEDVDLGLRIWSEGWTCRLVASAIVAHKGGGSTGGGQSDFAEYHGHRNIVWVFVKNMPGILFYIFLPMHILVNAHIRRVVSRQGRREIIQQSQSDALDGLSYFWAKRKECSRRRTIPMWAAWQFIHFSMPPEPWMLKIRKRAQKAIITVKRKVKQACFVLLPFMHRRTRCL